MDRPQRRILGLDVGGTKCAAVVGDEHGGVVDRIQWPSRPRRGPDAMIADLVANARALLARHGDVSAVGVAIGGPLDAEQGIILGPPNLPGWREVPLRQRLTRELDLPVFVEHDAAACALAESRWGRGRGATSLVYLTCGTGFGAGFVIGGRIHRGAGGRPSDIGHIRYRRAGPVAYGRRGALEAYAAAGSIGALAAWRFPRRWGEQQPDAREVARLAARGDADALAVFALNARAVGDACAMLADLLYPQFILLGSLARYLGAPWLGQVRARFEREAYPDAARLCRVEPAALGARLQDCSALVAALQADGEAAGTGDGGPEGP